MGGFARVVIDLSLDREFDYRIPDSLSDRVRLGSRVTVPFGRSRRTGYVVGLPAESSFNGLKDIESVTGDGSFLTGDVIELARWMSRYYAVPLEQSVRAVLPAPVRKRGVAHKKKRFAVLTGNPPDADSALQSRAPKQARILSYLQEHGDVDTATLLAACETGDAALKALVAKQWVRLEERDHYRDPFASYDLIRTDPLPLMDQQKEALALCRQAVDTLNPSVILLHGVTGSGKTEVYLQAIQYAMDAGKGAIVLVPEISLTPQTVDRFRSRFGGCVAVLHSELSEGERHDEWHRIRTGKALIVIGARSALFAPLPSVGLIIVDEEHEPTYKQSEAPRYQARDVAVMRGKISGCPVVLGSATPSIESYVNALAGKYQLVLMPHRVDHRKMPRMRVVDMRAEAEREGRVNVFSKQLVEAIDDRLARAEQVILFLNRRGYSSALICPRCGHVAECDHCSISMTYHKTVNKLLCHMCGHEKPVPDRCPNPDCRDPSFRFAGLGTQRVEEVLRRIFTRARIHRMDSDTMTRKDSYRTVLHDFRSGKIDILVGTQMIAKGLHFPNVTLVGVVNADTGLHMPDFRAAERTFQLLTQVAGRAGRGDIVGEVIVQTFTPHHWAVQAARRLDYEGFADQEAAFRRDLAYPPYTHLVCLTLRGKSESRIQFCGGQFLKKLQEFLSPQVTVTGPMPAPLARIKGAFRYHILLRAEKTVWMTGPIQRALAGFRFPPDVMLTVDVDASSVL